MGGGVQVLDNVNREGSHSCWGITLFLIVYQLVSQTKVDFSHAVIAGGVGPHGCEYLTDGVEVLIDQFLLGGLPMSIQKSGTNTLDKNLEERNWVSGAFKVRVDVQPTAEALPLVPVGGVFLEYCVREALGDILLYSIVVSCCLHSNDRGGRRQGLICGKCVKNGRGIYGR